GERTRLARGRRLSTTECQLDGARYSTPTHGRIITLFGRHTYPVRKSRKLRHAICVKNSAVRLLPMDHSWTSRRSVATLVPSTSASYRKRSDFLPSISRISVHRPK